LRQKGDFVPLTSVNRATTLLADEPLVARSAVVSYARATSAIPDDDEGKMIEFRLTIENRDLLAGAM
jgi:hypothetical protein